MKSRRFTKTGNRATVRGEVGRGGTAVTINVRDEPLSDTRDEEIYWPGPESAEEIIADVYSRR